MDYTNQWNTFITRESKNNPVMYEIAGTHEIAGPQPWTWEKTAITRERNSKQ
jgi:hypothetical protein